jgi:hypothetical protein
MLRLASSVNTALLRPLFLAAGFCLSFLSSAYAAALSPESAQTGTYVYQVMRDGEVVGEQRTDFERRGDELIVVTDVSINITLLGLAVYEFTQRIEETWAGGQLMAFSSSTNDDGNHREVRLKRDGNRLIGSYDGKERDLPGDLIPSTLWNSAVLADTAVLDTVKGRARTVQVAEQGTEQVKLPAGAVSAKHYVFSGEFKREVWYDESGILVASQMEAKDGSIIRQELLRMP